MKILKVLFLAASLLAHQSAHAELSDCVIDAHLRSIEVGSIGRDFCDNYDCVRYDFIDNSPDATFKNAEGSSYLATAWLLNRSNKKFYALFDNLLTSLVIGSKVSALGPSDCKDDFQTYFVSIGHM